MLKKSGFTKPLLVLTALMLAALACYSDSPLWPYELTQPPPSPTFLPTPDGVSTTAKFGPGDFVTGLRDPADPSPFLDLTNFPIPLTVTNASRENCNFGRAYEVLYTGTDAAGDVYQLIACQGSVGWTNENRLVGLQFLPGQSALTRPVDPSGRPLINNQFAIHNQEPMPNQPPPIAVLANVQCTVNEVVDVINLQALDENNIWYQVRCTNGQFGWVDQTRLFGPLELPAVGGVGVVNPAGTGIPLTASPEPVATSNTIGMCAPDTIVTTQGLELANEIVYYLLECDGVRGYTIQDELIELPYVPDSYILVYVPVVEEEEEETVDGEISETTDTTDDSIEADGGGEGEPEVVVLTAPLTEHPGLPDDDNPVVGECPTNSIVYIKDATATDFDHLAYEVECGDQSGWLDQFYVLLKANFATDSQVAITVAGFVGNTQAERAFYVSDVPKRVAGARGAIGVCQVDTLATIVDYATIETASGIGFYYQIVCQTPDGTELTGWSEQDRLRPADVLEDSATSTGIFG